MVGAAYGTSNSYATTLWEYLYGDADAHRIRQVAIALSTAASGVAVWLYALAWHRDGSYDAALLGSGLLALVLGLVGTASLAKPELLEAIVRRAPTWEQKLAFRQRAGYHSNLRSVKRLAALAAARAGVLPAVAPGGMRAAGAGATVAEDDGLRQAWVDATIEPVHQANPIVPAAPTGAA